MKKFLIMSVFLGVAVIALPSAAKAQYSTYTPSWEPAPNITQMIIEKNMMRDSLRRNKKKAAGSSSAKRRAAKKTSPMRSKRRVSFLENVITPKTKMGIESPREIEII